MICISVTPESRRLAAADLYNASRQCDIIEFCLDFLKKTPDVGALLEAVDKPVLVSCRRERDGGHWEGTEDERFQLLRSAIVTEPAYVELDLETAEKIPRFGKTKRVISYTNLNGALNQASVDKVLERCKQARADVVKFTWLTENLDDIWPLLSVVTQDTEIPVVGKGVGPGGLAFSLLGRRYGSPWIYAALERGMETCEGEASVSQLEDEYCWSDITRKTRFVGIVGRGAAENTTARILNAAFKEFDVPFRCLPIVPGRPDRLRKMLEVLKIRALVITSEYSGEMKHLVDDVHRSVGTDGHIDLMTCKEGRWKARNTLFDAIESAAKTVRQQDNWAQGRTIMVIGADDLSVSIACRFRDMNAAVSIASPRDNAATAAARKADVRHVPWAAIHGIVNEAVVLTDGSVKCGNGRGELNPSLLREGLTVIDMLSYPAESSIGEEARARGCHYVSPSMIFACQLQTQFGYLTGKSLPLEAFQKGLME